MKLKKLQLTTVLLFILTILIIIIGLMLIAFCNFHFYNNKYSKYRGGFSILKHFGISYIINHSATYFYNLGPHHFKENYYVWIQLKIGIIFCVILVPILIFIINSLIFLIIGLKIKVKNNNFWDAIQNCEIISNYYIHFKIMLSNWSYYI